jgi:hypothetical protein
VILDKDLVRDLWVISPMFRRPESDTERVELSFPFPFYGRRWHVLYLHFRDGMVSVEDSTYTNMLNGRYVAPMYVLNGYNTDAKRNSESRFAFLDDGDRLVVEWRSVILQEYASWPKKEVSMQAILDRSGDITFVYRKLDYSPGAAAIGISDSTLGGFQYHTVNLTNAIRFLGDMTAVKLMPLPGCMTQMDCQACLDFGQKCVWCQDKCTIKEFWWQNTQCPASNSARHKDECPLDNRKHLASSSRRTNVIVDGHGYYNYSLSGDAELFKRSWVALDDPDDPDVVALPLPASPVALPFDFPFFGRPAKRVLVWPSEGMLTMVEENKDVRSKDLYVAPLRADFDAR